MKTFQFQILRFLPDRVNGEFVNVGLMLFDPKGKELLGRVIHTTTGVHALFPDVAGRPLLTHLKETESRIENVAKQIKTELQFEYLDNLDAISKSFYQKMIVHCILQKQNQLLMWMPMLPLEIYLKD